jgi:hypothetical protein
MRENQVLDRLLLHFFLIVSVKGYAPILCDFETQPSICQ